MAFDLPTGPSDIRQVIQLAIAPVFLLTAVGTTLNVLTNRLARVVDRGRTLEALQPGGLSDAQRFELTLLERRARQVYVAIFLAVVSALLVSLLIALAFAGYVLGYALPWLMATLFMGAMLSLTAGLLYLLAEIVLALRGFQLGIEASASREPTSKERGP